MNETELDASSPIVDPSGRPAREALKKSKNCPRCGAGPEKRIASGGFGKEPHPICPCGHEWLDEVFRG